MGRRKKPLIKGVIREYWKKKGRRFTIKKLDRDTILIEGSSTALKFLGNLLIALTREDDCKIDFSPKGAGQAWFTKESTLGFYLHRLPCKYGKLRFPKRKRR
jgi:hypothetical protein